MTPREQYVQKKINRKKQNNWKPNKIGKTQKFMMAVYKQNAKIQYETKKIKHK